MKLLHIDSGIQGEQSASRAISAAIVERLSQDNSSLEVMYRDLVAAPIGHLLPADLAGAETGAILAAFLAADIVVIGTGLYNFSIPTQLKAWVDRILIAGQTFRYGPEGVEGLAKGKRILIGLARGGVYTAGTPMADFEHGETYLRRVFGFIGITNPEIIAADGLALGEEARATSIAAALDRARSIAPLAQAA